VLHQNSLAPSTACFTSAYDAKHWHIEHIETHTQGTEKMTNLEKIALNLLSTEEFFLGKKTYQRTSFEAMRANVISRARETLAGC
jgi:hypothetical protein